MEYIIQETKDGDVAYKTVSLDNPSSLSSLSSELAMRVIKQLSNGPSCALDVARMLKIHEQKVYYHMRNLEKAGIIKLIGTQERAGGTAKMYDLVAPVISVKLHEGEQIQVGHNKGKAKELDFLNPFVKNGKANFKIIVGLPYPHGNHDATARDNTYAVDLAFFLGNMVSEFNLPVYIIDTEVKEEDLKGNLIVIGGSKVNTITEKLNENLPVYFDANREWSIVSRKTNKAFKYDYDCLIVRMKNPFNPEAEVIVIAGKRSAGTISGVIAFTQHLNDLIKNSENGHFARVVSGVDRNGDGVIDSIKFLE